MLRFLTAAILTMAASFAQAQARIIDSQPVGTSSPRQAAPVSNSGSQARAASAADTELFFQLQTLQQEVLELRGLVEQQAHELKRLKQQRLDDYVDLDRRIGQLSRPPGAAQSPVSPSNTSVQSAASRVTPLPPASTSSSGDELASYRTAIDLILKKQDFDAGIVALNTYLRDYPRGNYAANAQYWLGQIYMQKNDLEQSKEWFGRMIAAYPQNQKADEARFKLGRVMHLLGETQKARVLLEEVAATNSEAATLAQAYLKENF